MDSRAALKNGIDMADYVAMAYLDDLTDTELMDRPHPNCNHINWQIGHLIVAEHQMIDQVAPGSMPSLPDGFADKYKKETAASNNPATFANKEELLRVHKEQRAGILAALAKMSDSDLDKPTGVEYAPTVGAMFSMQGSHWMMHSGQWVVVRRQRGRAPLF